MHISGGISNVFSPYAAPKPHGSSATDIPSPTSSSAKACRNPACVPLITPKSYPNMKPPIVATATISAIRPLLTRSSVPSVIPVSPCRPILVDRMNRHVSASSALRELFLEGRPSRSEEHTSELQSLMRISYAVFCLTQTKKHNTHNKSTTQI